MSTTDFESLIDSSPLLGQAHALRERFEQQGYLYLPRLIPTEPLEQLLGEMATLCNDAGWLRTDAPKNELVAWTEPAVEGEPEYHAVYDKVQRLEGFHALAHRPELIELMNGVLGGDSFPHPLSVARLMFPYNTPWATPPHQDYPNNQGTEDLFACWIPLSDCPIERGPLAVCPGSHKRGLLPLRYALGAGHREVFDDKTGDFHWAAGNLRAGDVLVFHSLTVHRSLANNSKQMRLSVDYRYQREGDALVEQSLLPHFQRESWDEIYQGWQSEDLKYYWRNKRYTEVNWDAELHEVVDQPMAEQVAVKRQYERYRAEVRAKLAQE